MKKYKNLILSIYIGLVICVGVIGLVAINIKNTKTLSPVGVSVEDNFEMVSEEFGKEFEKFIQDKAAVKIYKEDDGTLIKVNDVNFKIKNESEMLNEIKEKGLEIINGISEFF
ncbi:MAG: hypothetical protein ACRC28_02055 [Clostridium sp.]|uniref:hypothetical protein n=1 Tax=Clostridium sp. TaxID=1506 RepID=UPI003F304740